VVESVHCRDRNTYAEHHQMLSSNDILLQRPENTCCFFFKIRHSNIKILHDKTEVQKNNGVIVAVIVWQLYLHYNYKCNQCLKLWVQNPLMAIQHYVIKFNSHLRQVDGFLRVLQFPPPIKLTVTIYWNIVESGIKRHNHNLLTQKMYAKVHIQSIKHVLVTNSIKQ
jgi:hypothetical protein